MNTLGVGTLRVMTTLATLALVACGGATILGPDNEVQVSNNADDFTWRASDLVNVTDTVTFNWTITTPSAFVRHAHAPLTNGTATLTVLDADGMQVYLVALRAIFNNESATTLSGKAGTWTVTVTLNNATTTRINFQLTDIP